MSGDGGLPINVFLAESDGSQHAFPLSPGLEDQGIFCAVERRPLTQWKKGKAVEVRVGRSPYLATICDGCSGTDQHLR